MQEKVLKLIKKGYSTRKICNALDMSYSSVIAIIDDLLDKKIIAQSHSGAYKEVKVGKLILKPEGYGFIVTNDEDDDYYVPKGCTLDAVDGDDVSFYSFSGGRKLLNAEIIAVINRNTKLITGKVVTRKRKTKIKQYVKTMLNSPLDFVRLDDINTYEDGLIVQANVLYKPHQITCKVEQIIGKDTDKGIEITQIASNYGFKTEFSDETYMYLDTLSDEVEEKELLGRTDYTNENIITIDGDDAKDFDDAIYVKKLMNGNYELGVFIADVSNYVKHGTKIDDDAMHRGTSVYLADRVIPMLPFKLSNGLCSLNEGVIRLVMACIMEIDLKGNVVDYKINEGFIKSKHRMTYNNVNKILNNDEYLCDKYSDIVNMLNDANDLSKILRAKRYDKGGLDFEIDEYKIILDENKEPIDIILRQRDDAEKLIEDFMLLANNTVAYHLANLNLPCMYRIHEVPDQEKLREVFKIIQNMKISLKLPKNDIHPKLIQTALESLDGNILKPIINQLILRAMMKAKYTTKNVGHYGLCMDYYCHFTSPIRRYPDLIVHRIIKELLIHPTNFENHYKYYDEQLENIAILNSNSERKAIECEREVNDMLMAWYMQNYIGKTFSGIVVGLTSYGMFVALDNGVEGMIHIRNMDGYFVYDEAKQILKDEHRTFKLGQNVEVVVLYSSKVDKKIDLMLKEDYLNMEDDYGYYKY